MNPEYPIYIVSKGRWELRHTSKVFERCAIPYRIVIEPQEYEQYAAVIDSAKILVLPFSNLGLGSIPARNWIWEHSISEGHRRHWILDDNILYFYRVHQNELHRITSGTIFKAAEDFVERYTNVGLAGFDYYAFYRRRSGSAPVRFNTRIYSCILIDNALPFRWRGRYNEDTDLSLQVLKSGLCTVLFNAFLADKRQTMQVKGGNTDELYQGDGRLKMAQSLIEQHPDVTTMARKWGRWQHVVDYRPFKANRLIKRPDVVIPSKPNEYGMKLVRLDDTHE